MCGYCGECQLDLQASSSLWALKNEMMAGAAQMFTTYHEKYIARIRSHVYWKKSKLEQNILGYDANSLYPYCSGNVMPCGKDTLVVN